MGGLITSAQRRHFEEAGYLVLPRAIPPEALAALRGAAREIVAAFDIAAHRSVFSTRDRDRGRDAYFMDSAQAVHCFLEEEALDADGRLLTEPQHAINKIGHALHDLDPTFRDFCRLPLFGDALRALGYEQPVLWQTMYIFKQPRIGGEVRWHQDARYLISGPPGITGVWVALEDATRDNGCLWVQPGAHRSPLREIYEVDPVTRCGALRTLDATPWPDESGAVALELAAGGVVLFSDRLPHYSSPNRSERSRQAFTLHAGEAGAAWSERNWLQRPELGQFHL